MQSGKSGVTTIATLCSLTGEVARKREQLRHVTIRSQEATQRHLGFDKDKTELLSACAEYQIISMDTTQSECMITFLGTPFHNCNE